MIDYLKKGFQKLYKELIFKDFASSLSSVEQKNLLAQYRIAQQVGATPFTFADVGFRAHSQFEEDGILLYLFSLIGFTNKKCVEICAGDGIECNTANLILNHQFSGLLFDGDAQNIAKAKQFYALHADSKHWPPTIVQAWITKGNINNLVRENGFEGEIDLLSLDIDGNDYWIWQALDTVNPRVVVLEFNHLWGPETSVTVPYADDFRAEATQFGFDYAGASLAAFIKLGKQKGFRFVGTNAIATNAFFVRDTVQHPWLPEADPKMFFDHPRAKFGMEKRLPAVRDKQWVKI